VTWSTPASNGSDLFTFRWQEEGGPPVSPPAQKGFGSTLLEQVMAEHFEVAPRIDFLASGARYELSGSLYALTTGRTPFAPGNAPMSRHSRVLAGRSPLAVAGKGDLIAEPERPSFTVAHRRVDR
jgi:hypothetical protein